MQYLIYPPHLERIKDSDINGMHVADLFEQLLVAANTYKVEPSISLDWTMDSDEIGGSVLIPTLTFSLVEAGPVQRTANEPEEEQSP